MTHNFKEKYMAKRKPEEQATVENILEDLTRMDVSRGKVRKHFMNLRYVIQIMEAYEKVWGVEVYSETMAKIRQDAIDLFKATTGDQMPKISNLESIIQRAYQTWANCASSVSMVMNLAKITEIFGDDGFKVTFGGEEYTLIAVNQMFIFWVSEPETDSKRMGGTLSTGYHLDKTLAGLISTSIGNLLDEVDVPDEIKLNIQEAITKAKAAGY